MNMKTILISTMVCLLVAPRTYALTGGPASSTSTTDPPTTTGSTTAGTTEATSTTPGSTTSTDAQTTTPSSSTESSTDGSTTTPGSTTTTDQQTTPIDNTGSTTTVESTTTSTDTTGSTTTVESTATSTDTTGSTTTVEPTTTSTDTTGSTTTVEPTTTPIDTTGSTTTVEPTTTSTDTTGSTTTVEPTTTPIDTTGSTTTVEPTTTSTDTTGSTTTVEPTTTPTDTTSSTTTIEPTTTSTDTTGSTTTVEPTTTSTDTTGSTTTVEPTTTSTDTTGSTTTVEPTTTSTDTTGSTTTVEPTTTSTDTTGSTTTVGPTTTPTDTTGSTTTVESTTTSTDTTGSTTTVEPTTTPTDTTGSTTTVDPTTTSTDTTGSTTTVESTTTSTTHTDTTGSTTTVESTSTPTDTTGSTTTIESTTTPTDTTGSTTTVESTTTSTDTTGSTTTVELTTTPTDTTGSTTTVESTTTSTTPTDTTGSTTTIESTTTSTTHTDTTGSTTTVESTSTSTTPTDSTGSTTTVESTTTSTTPTDTTGSTTTVESTTTSTTPTDTTGSTTTVESTTTSTTPSDTTGSTTTVESTTTSTTPTDTTGSTTTVESTTTSTTPTDTTGSTTTTTEPSTTVTSTATPTVTSTATTTTPEPSTTVTPTATPTVTSTTTPTVTSTATTTTPEPSTTVTPTATPTVTSTTTPTVTSTATTTTPEPPTTVTSTATPTVTSTTTTTTPEPPTTVTSTATPTVTSTATTTTPEPPTTVTSTATPTVTSTATTTTPEPPTTVTSTATPTVTSTATTTTPEPPTTVTSTATPTVTSTATTTTPESSTTVTSTATTTTPESSTTVTSTATTTTAAPPLPRNYGLLNPDYDTMTYDEPALGGDDACAPKLTTSIKFPFGGKMFYKIYVCTNGYISLHRPYYGYVPPDTGSSPNTIRNRDLIAPFFVDLDATVNGRVLYQLYDLLANGAYSSDPVVQLAKDLVLSQYNVSDFDACITLQVTWERMPTFGGDVSKTATFQLILTTDGLTSYAFYSYLYEGMNIVGTRVFIGEVVDGLAVSQFDNTNPGVASALLRPDIPPIADYVNLCNDVPCVRTPVGFTPDNTEKVCTKWRNQEKEYIHHYIPIINRMGACHCHFFLALFSGQYRIVWVDFSTGVITMAFIPNRNVGVRYGQLCSYSLGNLGFIGRGRYAGYFQSHNMFYDPRENQRQDTYYHNLCCRNNYRFCDVFYEVRPATSYCRFDWFLFLSIMFGDPHYTTLDGLTYTFNGKGEYVMVSIPTEDFQIQARTGQAILANGTFSQATIFTAFVIQGGDSWMQMELNENRTRVSLLSGYNRTTYIDYTRNFEDDGDNFNVINKPGPTLRRSNVTLIADFPDFGITFNITIGKQLLRSSIAMNGDYRNLTTGLLGNFDGIKENDLLPQDATEPLQSTALESDIFHNFGKTWATKNDEESIFYYRAGFSHASYNATDFIPLFYDDITQSELDAASIICGGNDKKQCIYDLVATGDIELALQTNDAERENDINIAIAENRIPLLSVTDGTVVRNDVNYAEVTVGEEHVITIAVNDTDAVTVSALTNTAGATITANNDGSATVTFTLTDTNPAELSIIGTDSQGATSAVLGIVLVVCTGCNSPNGVCNFTDYQETGNLEENFELAVCECTDYWTGDSCEADFDACNEMSCSFGQDCIDTNATDQVANNSLPAFTCTPCPDGYTDNGSKCLDNDECVDTSICTNSVCVNIDGSYTCTCNSGFRQGASLTTCEDIDECAISQDDCDQICTNIDGNFTCTCFAGFVRDTGDTACVDDGLPPPAACVGNCTNANCTLNADGNPVCFCDIGYELTDDTLDPDGCTDVNECDLGLCSQDCVDDEGGFTCSCYTGYILDDDGITCTACTYPNYGPNCASTCQCGRGSVRCDPVHGCVCGEGWTGDTCSSDVNECDDVTLCPRTEEYCVNSIGSYNCACNEGYSLQDLGSGPICSDIENCEDITLNECQQTCNNTQGSYSCGCFSGYNVNPTNNTLCDDIDECAEGIAECNQDCTNVPGRYNCECYAGYALLPDRKTCVDVDDLCRAFNTKNCSDICVVENNAPVCYCNIGYVLGADNQTCIDINECLSDTTNRCSEKDTCKNSEGSYTCSCVIGYRLENDQRTCAACDEEHYGINCENVCNCGEGGADCHPETGCVCKPGWAGEKCDTDQDECEQSPCTGDNESCINQRGTYSCACASGYENTTGSCTDVNECSSDNLNLCSQMCNNTDGGYECSCNPGFIQDGNTCNDVDECSLQHNCEQICNNMQGGYRCSCEADFQLNADKRSCTPTNLCVNPTICEGEADCVNRSGVDTCVCKQGFEFDTASTTVCVDIKECETVNPCSQVCNEESGGYNCSCDQIGYILDADESTCIACDQGTYGQDCAVDCTCIEANTASCNHTDGGCTCNSGWEGNTCEVNIDECLDHPCPSQSACVDTDGSYICQCIIGYIKAADGTCAACDPNHWGQNCAFQCTCTSGNTEDCNDETGDCTCLLGWKGTTCAYNIDECTELNDVCNDALKTCEDNDGGYDCLCDSGYTINSDDVCVDNNECLLDTHNCDGVGQTCVNTVGTFNCSCADGYSGDGVTCTSCASGTWGEQCGNTCSCNVTNTDINCDTVRGCVCKTGWQGLDCSEDIEECATNTHTCPTHSQCSNTQGDYECPCDTGYKDAADGTCAMCDQNTFGDNCSSTCDCVVEHARFVDQTCDHSTGNCICKSTWSGVNCELDFDECSSVTDVCPIVNQGCHNYEGGYNCSCLVGNVRDANGDCVISTATSTTPELPVATVRVFVRVVLIGVIEELLAYDSHNLTVGETLRFYTRVVLQALKAYFQSEMKATHFRNIHALSVESGSLIANVSVDIVDTDEAKKDFSVAIDDLANGAHVNVNGTNATAQNLYVGEDSNVDLVTASEKDTKCTAYFTTGVVCSTNEECDLVDGNPHCVLKPTDDNLGLILGLGVGIPLFFIVVLLIAVAVLLYMKNRRRRYKAEDFDRTTFNQGFFPAVVPTKINTWGRSDPVFGPYGWDQQSGNSFTTSSSSDETHKKRRRRRREDPYEREEYAYDNQNNFSWDFLYNYIAPNERYEIQRPHVDSDGRGYRN